jgi:hypothetical protein
MPPLIPIELLTVKRAGHGHGGTPRSTPQVFDTVHITKVSPEQYEGARGRRDEASTDFHTAAMFATVHHLAGGTDKYVESKAVLSASYGVTHLFTSPGKVPTLTVSVFGKRFQRLSLLRKKMVVQSDESAAQTFTLACRKKGAARNGMLEFAVLQESPLAVVKPLCIVKDEAPPVAPTPPGREMIAHVTNEDEKIDFVHENVDIIAGPNFEDADEGSDGAFQCNYIVGEQRTGKSRNMGHLDWITAVQLLRSRHTLSFFKKIHAKLQASKLMPNWNPTVTGLLTAQQDKQTVAHIGDSVIDGTEHDMQRVVAMDGDANSHIAPWTEHGGIGFDLNMKNWSVHHAGTQGKLYLRVEEPDSGDTFSYMNEIPQWDPATGKQLKDKCVSSGKVKYGLEPDLYGALADGALRSWCAGVEFSIHSWGDLKFPTGKSAKKSVSYAQGGIFMALSSNKPDWRTRCPPLDKWLKAINKSAPDRLDWYLEHNAVKFDMLFIDARDPDSLIPADCLQPWANFTLIKAASCDAHIARHKKFVKDLPASKLGLAQLYDRNVLPGGQGVFKRAASNKRPRSDSDSE